MSPVVYPVNFAGFRRMVLSFPAASVVERQPRDQPSSCLRLLTQGSVQSDPADEE